MEVPGPGVPVCFVPCRQRPGQAAPSREPVLALPQASSSQDVSTLAGISSEQWICWKHMQMNPHQVSGGQKTDLQLSCPAQSSVRWPKPLLQCRACELLCFPSTSQKITCPGGKQIHSADPKTRHVPKRSNPSEEQLTGSVVRAESDRVRDLG